MNFTWLNKQGVRSDSGFELQREDRFTMSYREENRVISIDVENGMLGGATPAVLMGPDALETWDDGVPLDEQKQKQVLRNIESALKFQDIVLSVE